MRLSELHVFPVKSLAGTTPPSAMVEPWGLQHDRRWLVVDQNGRFLTQRALPRMALITAAPQPDGIRLVLAGAGGMDVAIPRAGAPVSTVAIWRDVLPAADAGQAAADWLTEVLGTECRLVHMHDTRARAIDPAHGRPGETVNFADGYPVLLTTLGSLADLNARLGHPVPISRFRANLVVGGAAAWAEDSWRVIRIGGAVFRVAKPCDRCIVTTIDQLTGERPDRTEPLRTLESFRHDERGIKFGQNLVPMTPGRVSVGDTVEVLETGPANVTPLSDDWNKPGGRGVA